MSSVIMTNAVGHPAPPIHQLCPDILIEIFRILLDISGGTRTIPIPFVLSQVCRVWREVALSFPSLWAKIRIPLDFDYEFTHEDIAECLPFMFERSASHPISIHYEPSSEAEPFTGQIMPLLLSQVHRWDFVYLWFSCSEMPPRYTETPFFDGLEAPRLRHLIIILDNTPTELPFPLASCPSLERLTWPFLETLQEQNDAINWSLLEEIIAEKTPVGTALDVLEWAVHLVDFTLSLEYEDESEDVENQKERHLVTNHSLKTLDIDGARFGPLFNTISLPQLSTLTINGDTEGLEQLLARSQCSLTSLYIGQTEEDPDFSHRVNLEDVLLLPGSSSLTDLRIRDGFTTFTDELIKRMTYPSSSSSASEVICPNLEVLSLQAPHCSSPFFGHMIQSRFTDISSCFKRFYCYLDKGDVLSQELVGTFKAIPNVITRSRATFISIKRQNDGDSLDTGSSASNSSDSSSSDSSLSDSD